MSKVGTIKSALKFLVQKQIEQGSHGFSDADDNEMSWKEVLEWIEQSTVKMAEDCISREAVKESIFEQGSAEKLEIDFAKLLLLQRAIKVLPSVQPQPKRGKWIDEGQYAEGHSHHAYECSKCGNHIIELKPDDFCKFCGADMREVKADE